MNAEFQLGVFDLYPLDQTIDFPVGQLRLSFFFADSQRFYLSIAGHLLSGGRPDDYLFTLQGGTLIVSLRIDGRIYSYFAHVNEVEASDFVTQGDLHRLVYLFTLKRIEHLRLREQKSTPVQLPLPLFEAAS